MERAFANVLMGREAVRAFFLNLGVTNLKALPLARVKGAKLWARVSRMSLASLGVGPAAASLILTR